jgi:hypothetical protein
MSHLTWRVVSFGDTYGPDVNVARDMESWLFGDMVPM